MRLAVERKQLQGVTKQHSSKNVAVIVKNVYDYLEIQVSVSTLRAWPQPT